MLLANYASDSDEGSDSESPSIAAPVRATINKPAPKPAAAAPVAPSKPITKARKPVKITLDLPKTSDDAPKSGKDGRENVDDDAAAEKEDRGVKKPNIAGGKGGSSLLGMLPAPKRKLPQPAQSRGSSLSVNKSMASSSSASSSISKPLLASTRAAAAASSSGAGSGAGGSTVRDGDDDEDDDGDKLLPPSLAKKRKLKEKEEALDLFGLASSSSTPAPAIPASTSVKPPSISSAPLAPDYVPPPPSSTDPYPGYYQLPSGEWKAYDPEYYHSFFPSTSGARADGEEEEDGRVGKHWNEFESGKYGGVVEVSAMKGVEDARREEERRNLTKLPKKTGEDFDYKPTGQIKGLATQRHQLSSLLNTAYTQREELEERIAANKKSMRMAGTKYGF